jgi:hypothetical protein
MRKGFQAVQREVNDTAIFAQSTRINNPQRQRENWTAPMESVRNYT